MCPTVPDSCLKCVQHTLPVAVGEVCCRSSVRRCGFRCRPIARSALMTNSMITHSNNVRQTTFHFSFQSTLCVLMKSLIILFNFRELSKVFFFFFLYLLIKDFSSTDGNVQKCIVNWGLLINEKLSGRTKVLNEITKVWNTENNNEHLPLLAMIGCFRSGTRLVLVKKCWANGMGAYFIFHVSRTLRFYSSLTFKCFNIVSGLLTLGHLALP